MAENRQDLPVERQYRRLLKHFFGADARHVAVGAVFFLISLGWMGDSLADLIKWGLGGMGVPEWLAALLLLVPFWVYFMYVLRVAKKGSSDFYVSLRQEPNPEAVEGLVLYMSLPNEQQLAEFMALEGDICEAACRSQLGKNPLRMPLEAIAYHVSKLRTIVILESKETAPPPNPAAAENGVERPTQGEEPPPATAEERRERVQRPGPGGSIEFRRPFAEKLRQLGLPADIELAYAENFGAPKETGIDFFDLEEIFLVTSKAVKSLGKRYGARKILIDVTGGTKVTTCAAASVAFGEDRRYQYVNTHDYSVIVCDPVYDPP